MGNLFVSRYFLSNLALILNSKCGNVSTYKYFEIDIIENPDDANIYIGLCEYENFRNDALPKDAPSTVI